MHDVNWWLMALAFVIGLVLTFALMTPIILFPLAMLRYGHHRSWRKRIPRVIAFIMLYLLINAVLFVVLTVALIIVIACFDPGHFMA